MPQEAVITSAQAAGALLNGAVLALVLVAVTHVLRRYARQILFLTLVIASLVYVVFAARARAGPIWLLVEVLGVFAYAAIGWKGLRGPIWWLAAGWALHPIWDVGLHYIGSGRSFAPPLSYPIPCVSFDLLVAAYAALRASREATSARRTAVRVTTR